MADAGNEAIYAQKTIETNVYTIEGLINTSEGLIYNVVYCWSDLLFKESLRAKIRNAHNELKFDLMKPDAFPDDVNLDEVGLGGSQLILKLSGLSEELSSFVETPNIQKLLSIFDWLISILGSMANASK
jgi:hypothetical protein